MRSSYLRVTHVAHEEAIRRAIKEIEELPDVVNVGFLHSGGRINYISRRTNMVNKEPQREHFGKRLPGEKARAS